MDKELYGWLTCESNFYCVAEWAESSESRISVDSVRSNFKCVINGASSMNDGFYDVINQGTG